MITIIGSGKVGSSAALQIAMREVDKEVLLLDIVEGLPQGEAMDINHLLSERGIDTKVRGSNNYEDMKGSDIVVIIAGVGRKPGMTRMDLLNTNSSIVKSVAEKVKEYAKDSIVITVTNPLDPMTYVTYKVTGFSKERVMGMGNLLDLSRFKSFIADRIDIARDSIQALVIGEHGENMLPLVRYSSVSGIPLTNFLNKDEAKALVEDTRKVAAEVIRLKGATVYAPANAITKMVDSIIKDRKQVIPVAAYLEGEYNVNGICIGVPAVIGRDGINKIIEIDLDEEERSIFDKGVESVKNAVNALSL
ncbi:MAG: malate dehydrogenase [Candidatus Nitrosocaldaceae archaeon]|nr:MAG: malate dehydrogenase [Candidatus Nitrosocaldaceae archaeon]